MEENPFGSTSVPLYQTTTFKQPSMEDFGRYDYTRSGNPTRDALEKLLAHVEGASRAFAFSTGMAAISTATKLVPAGGEVLAGDDLYGGTDRWLSRTLPKFSNITVRRVNTSNIEEVKSAMTSRTRLIIMESPTNPRMRVSDIRQLSEIAHSFGALLLIDNSIMSPVLSKPLELGADIVMHSATKFISGHGDVMAGVLAVRDEKLSEDLYFLQNAEGTGLSPFDCWLCLRGIKTMPLRVERQQANAQAVASFLASHPVVEEVLYVGLPSHPGHGLHMSQAKGPGSVLSFRTGSVATSRRIVEGLSRSSASITVSFGSVATTVSMPAVMSHASIPEHIQRQRGLQPDLIRLSVGIEDLDDIIADLAEALNRAKL